ncbi:MAG TPA: PaaI family thioesterase [Deltaproteobacteria bacterium]|nr:MAG: hypothetical protein DRG83_16650 [Deltaproteobacteria bacterium]RLB07897.1 MAG: hypothetical protein DRG59_05840 [Deltaproteobacteria bacterium]HDM74858.1 PaaI family thioesterase [Deltaproteobacteria bacterium]
MDEYRRLFELSKNIPAWKFLGVQVLKLDKGFAELELPFRSDLINSMGVIQGGFITAIADAAGGWAILTFLDSEVLITTIELKINFLKPARDDIIARGRALHVGSAIGTSQVDVMLKNGELIAAGIATYYQKRGRRGARRKQ